MCSISIEDWVRKIFTQKGYSAANARIAWAIDESANISVWHDQLK